MWHTDKYSLFKLQWSRDQLAPPSCLIVTRFIFQFAFLTCNYKASVLLHAQGFRLVAPDPSSWLVWAQDLEQNTVVLFPGNIYSVLFQGNIRSLPVCQYRERESLRNLTCDDRGRRKSNVQLHVRKSLRLPPCILEIWEWGLNCWEGGLVWERDWVLGITLASVPDSHHHWRLLPPCQYREGEGMQNLTCDDIK